MKNFYVLIFLMFISLSAISQQETDERAFLDFKNGLGFKAPDSLFFVNIRFRMQNRAAATFDDDFDLKSYEATIRRLRLRFDGFILNPKFTYLLQLSFALDDQDWDNPQRPNIIRDAIIHYHFNNRFYVSFGQGKLPGNRQRVMSSGSLQFADRSIVNSQFTLDRDFGFFAYYTLPIKNASINFKGAISTGEGRNIKSTDKGLQYTGRVEVLPFGKFKSRGDYFEGDLLFEDKPKLSVAFTWALNQDAIRTQGQRGHYFAGSRDIETMFADMIFKYKGWAFQTEYAKRDIDNPFVKDLNNNDRFMLVGEGINQQLSYCFRNNFEIAGRFSYIRPYEALKNFDPDRRIYTLGLNKYLANHKTKFQLNFSRIEEVSSSIFLNPKNSWNVMFQVEVGI